ncbi:MAG: SsrA-binding protein, partial [Bacilli bacterium]|nr:SsrA-binding protein [Bacilli bacterium]
GLCKGKKNFDKRESIKERDIKRQLDKASKNKYYNS